MLSFGNWKLKVNQNNKNSKDNFFYFMVR